MYGLNTVALVFFGVINVSAYLLCGAPCRLRQKAVKTLCVLVLSLNLFRYGIFNPFILGRISVPVEFSTVAYFAAPAILLVSNKKFHSWAAYSGLMAGFFYYIAMIAAGGFLYGAYAPFEIYISMFCHGTIYFCGLVTVRTELLDKKSSIGLAAGVVFVALRAGFLRPLVEGSGRMLIYILLDGVCVKKVFPQSVWGTALPVYYVAIALFVFITIQGFFRKNRKYYRRFCGESNSF